MFDQSNNPNDHSQENILNLLTISNKTSIDVKISRKKSIPELTEEKKIRSVHNSKRKAIQNYFQLYIEFLKTPCIIFYYDTVCI